jgi:hypothetical protein
MVLKELINKSWYAANGFINSIDSIELLESYILYNMLILQEFKGIIVATTYKEQDPILIEANKKLWTKYFSNIILIDIKDNRGHSFGIADSENALVNYCKENNINWICKSSNDVIIQDKILNKEIDNADFYYMNGIGVGGMIKYDFDFDRISNEDFYPQTNFYFIDVSKIDYLYSKQYVNETYEYIQTVENYNGKIWEYIHGWECERFLKQCVERNNLTKYHLVSQEKYRILLHIIKEYNIHDPSHKNIMIEGICHLQYPEQHIIEI